MLDVVIVGAGVAGLAAASALRQAGLRVRVYEARDRIGGRIFTLHDDACPVAIELGAEFLHGEARETARIAEAGNLLISDIRGDRFSVEGGRILPMPEFWNSLDEILGEIDTTDPDESFADFLSRRPGGLRKRRERELARQFVEGFHAADTARISAHSVAEGGSPGGDPQQERQGRLPLGYDAIPRALAAGLEDVIRLRAPVRAIHWAPGRVHVRTRIARRTIEEKARAVVLTVPLGVLQAGMIDIEPAIPSFTRALPLLIMGSVLRVSLLFRERFWELPKLKGLPAGESLVTAAFVHTGDPHYPILWTTLPNRAPMLVLWAGGPAAAGLGDSTEESRVDGAVAALAGTFAMPPRSVRQLLVRGYSHDWQADPFSLGAYSYTAVGGMKAAGLLARPTRQTVFIAGEAASPEGRNGTVDGAIATGLRAARQVMSALG